MISRRVSCRTYSAAPVGDELRAGILSIIARPRRGPFGGGPRFRLLDFPGMDGHPRLGTYGFVGGATLYLAGAIERGRWAGTDFGYCMQDIILELTALGLGTCWLEATFDRGRVARALGLEDGEIIPAVSPVGHPADRRSMVDRAIKIAARSRTRKPWDRLFFHASTGEPLSPGEAGLMRDPLESVRLAPSAANRQPWRVWVDTETAACHFFSHRNPKLDLGISMLHLDAVARERGMKGGWERTGAVRPAPGLHYVATWLPVEQSRDRRTRS